MATETKNLETLISQLKMTVNTFQVISDEEYNYFKQVTKKIAGNLFCDLILRDLKGVTETIAQVYYDPQYDDSIVIESGANLERFLHSPEDLAKAEQDETIKYISTVEETESELIRFLQNWKPSRTRVLA